MCGGTRYRADVSVAVSGLSPRVRGNPGYHADLERYRGSIPACAGEPPLQDLYVPNAMVYPRVCGGTPRRVY